VDRYALTCPCTCHGRYAAECDPRFPAGCGVTHGIAGHSGAERAGEGSPSPAPSRHVQDRCPGCDHPVADGALCWTCTGHLAGDLAEVPWLSEELDTWRAKLDRMGGRGKGPSGGNEMPLGYRPMAVEVADVLHLTLARWAAELGHTGPGKATPAVLADYLAEHAEQARHLAESAKLVDEVGYAVSTVRRAVDRPAERLYAGPCEVMLFEHEDDEDGAVCGAQLYASQDAAMVVCEDCGATYTLRERREWLLDGLREHVATAAEIARGVGELYGVTVNRKAINLWHHRNRLLPAGHTDKGSPLFKIGDVLALATQEATVGAPA
jgi:hypothetical protein